MTRLANKVAIVTGASSGIGHATARLFVREGARVVVTARRQAELDGLVGQIVAAAAKGSAGVAGIGDEPHVGAARADRVHARGQLLVQDRAGHAACAAVPRPRVVHQVELVEAVGLQRRGQRRRLRAMAGEIDQYLLAAHRLAGQPVERGEHRGPRRRRAGGGGHAHHAILRKARPLQRVGDAAATLLGGAGRAPAAGELDDEPRAARGPEDLDREPVLAREQLEGRRVPRQRLHDEPRGALAEQRDRGRVADREADLRAPAAPDRLLRQRDREAAAGDVLAALDEAAGDRLADERLEPPLAVQVQRRRAVLGLAGRRSGRLARCR